MSVVKEQKREASSARMLVAARDEFSIKGYSGARIAAMAVRAGVSKGLLSQRFGSKEALYFEVFKQQFSDFTPLSAYNDTLQSLVDYIIDYIKRKATCEPENFQFAYSFFFGHDVPEICLDFYEKWFSESGLGSYVAQIMQLHNKECHDPFAKYYSFIRLCCGITKSFMDMGLNPPSNDKYIDLVGLDSNIICPVSSEEQAVSEEQRRTDIINVLASEYNAVYYCDALTHDYDIMYQKGSVREELLQTLKLLPKFEDAFSSYVRLFVHPDDKAMMTRELEMVTTRLKKRKSYKIEFRRMYDGAYLYTEMNCVKLGEAEDELRYFVVGFLENDSQYHSVIEQNKQLEAVVTDRTAELQERNRTLNRVNEEIIELLGNITEARDVESGEHIRRVKGFTNIIAKQVMHDWPEYSITQDIVELMTSASALHDIGKIMIPDAILLKPGRLSQDEFALMKTHCEKGCEILQKAPSDWSESYLRISLDICRYHHEKYDGRGYPTGLSGDAIPISAQIVSIADCFDALTTKRVYKDAYEPEIAFNMIVDGECGAFSPKLMQSFISAKKLLFRHVSDTSQRAISSLPAGISTESLSWTRILFVDDNEVIRELGIEILEGEGATIVPAASGKEAVEIFAASPEKSFDAILMDVMMPDMSGIEAASAIRALNRADAKSVSIIALTSLSTENDINLCLDAGMDSFITKPISVSAVNKVLFECMQSHSEALGHAVKKADKEAMEKLDTAMRKSPAFSGINADFGFACYINATINDVPCYRCAPVFDRIINSINSRLPSNRRLDQFFNAIIPQKDMAKFKEDTDRNKIISYLTTHESYHVFVPLVIEGEESLYRLRIIADADIPGAYVIGLQAVDVETRDEVRASELINKLSESYLEVDYVDFEEDKFFRYRTSRQGNNSDNTGIFSTYIASYIESSVHPEDKEYCLKSVNADNIRTQLTDHKRIRIRYRSLCEGTSRYYEFQFANAGDDDNARYAILTVTDIDDIIRKEIDSSRILLETRRQLIEAEKRSNRDALTGVKNITAYTESVALLSESIKNEIETQFAIVACDINRLKDVNEKYGHDVGDVYICNSCRIICDVFKRSPVFRTGGDEFVVLLKGADYSNRDLLMNELRQSVEKAEAIPDYNAGRASLSAGMAEYDPGIDQSVADVVKRADSIMFINKNSR